jgi:hypothetical protein
MVTDRYGGTRLSAALSAGGRSDPNAVNLSTSPRISQADPRDRVAYIPSRPVAADDERQV